MITIMQKSHTVKQSEIQLTKNILIKTLGPWKLILWFRKPGSFICIMSVYIYTCINLSYDDIGFKEVFFLSRSTSKTLIKEGLDTTQYLVTNLEDDKSQVAYTTVSILSHYFWSHLNWLPCNLHVLLSNFDWN